MAEARKSKVVESMESNPMDKYPLPPNTKEYMGMLYELIPNTLKLLKEKGTELKKEIVNYVSENTLTRPELNKVMSIVERINKDITEAQQITDTNEKETFYSDMQKVVSYSKCASVVIAKYAALESYQKEFQPSKTGD